MLDIKLIRENPDFFKKGLSKKRQDPKIIDHVLQIDEERRELIQKTEEIKAEKNKASDKIAKLKGKEKEKTIEEMQDLTKQEKNLIKKLEDTESKFNELMQELPNPPLESVPEGKDESENVVIKTVGGKPDIKKPLDHIEIGQKLDIIDIESAVKTSGTRFYYLKNEAVQLEFALVQFVLNKLISKGFTPVIPPVLVKEHAMWATGFFPADKNEIYHVNPEDDDMYLIGTSEVPLTMLHADQIINKELPLHYTGFSPCFRREAGSYGKDTHGILRVHQFDKIEMYSFCHPNKSQEEHELILGIEEEIMQNLGFHYQVVNICGGDLGAPAAKKYDIEAWIPSQNKFRELTSCSNCTDFQARRAKIRFKENSKNKFVHTLNGTACAIGRTLIAILENYQKEDGSVEIPEVLRPYLGNKDRIQRK